MSEGWVCPKCGRVWAPHIEGCPCATVPPLNPLPNVPVWPSPWGPIPPVICQHRWQWSPDSVMYTVTGPNTDGLPVGEAPQ